MGAMPEDDGVFRFRKVGINRASTFTGFCQKHDTELFRPLETQPFIASKEQLFLLAYRALAKEVYAKRFALRMEPLERRGDMGKSPLEQVALQSHLYLWAQQHRLSLRDLDANMDDYGQIYQSRDFDRMSAYLIFANSTIDFAVSGGLYPEFDFAGKGLQNLAGADRLDFITYSALPFETGSVIAFVWDSARGVSCAQFVRSLDQLPEGEIPDATVRLTFEHFENTFLAPRWWDGLSDSERDRLEQRFALAASPQNRSANCLADDGLRTAHWKVLSREWR
jgi:hypothetical protein